MWLLKRRWIWIVIVLAITSATIVTLSQRDERRASPHEEIVELLSSPELENQPEMCGEWFSVVVLCNCDGDLFSYLSPNGSLRGRIFCTGECKGDCECYQDAGFAEDPDEEHVELPRDRNLGRKWVEIACPSHLVSQEGGYNG